VLVGLVSGGHRDRSGFDIARHLLATHRAEPNLADNADPKPDENRTPVRELVEKPTTSGTSTDATHDDGTFQSGRAGRTGTGLTIALESAKKQVSKCVSRVTDKLSDRSTADDDGANADDGGSKGVARTGPSKRDKRWRASTCRPLVPAWAPSPGPGVHRQRP
jgi:hypothetical protein